MPYTLKRVDGGYEVVNAATGRKHGKTTKTMAQKQMNLLRAIEHGWKPTGKKSK